jgi:uncharacterized SAM-binding protein YcdF (DUF218 family)
VKSRRSRSRVALWVLGSALASLGLLLVLVTVTPVVFWWAGVLAGPWEDPNGDVLIVLGGSLLDKGLMGQSSYWRSVYALRAWRQGSFQKIVINGGPADCSIAEPMRDFSTLMACRVRPFKSRRSPGARMKTLYVSRSY